MQTNLVPGLKFNGLNESKSSANNGIVNDVACTLVAIEVRHFLEIHLPAAVFGR